MKRFIALMLTLCLLPLFALAEMNEAGEIVVELSGATFTFMPPEGLICLTRESSASVFNRIGLSQRDTLPAMEAGGIYALLYDADIQTEIQIIAYPTAQEDFADLTDYGEELLRASTENFYAECGYDVQFCEVYSVIGGHRFICISMSAPLSDGTSDHMAEYMTCHGGYCVTITLYTYETAPTEEQLALGDALADSLWIRADAVVLDMTGD